MERDRRHTIGHLSLITAQTESLILPTATDCPQTSRSQETHVLNHRVWETPLLCLLPYSPRLSSLPQNCFPGGAWVA